MPLQELCFVTGPLLVSGLHGSGIHPRRTGAGLDSCDVVLGHVVLYPGPVVVSLSFGSRVVVEQLRQRPVSE